MLADYIVVWLSVAPFWLTFGFVLISALALLSLWGDREFDYRWRFLPSAVLIWAWVFGLSVIGLMWEK